MKTKLYYDTRIDGEPDEKKEYPVKVAINSKGRSAYISTGVRIIPAYWDDENREVVNHPQASHYNIILTGAKLKIDRALEYLKECGRLHGRSATEIRELVVDELSEKSGQEEEMTVNEAFERVARLKDKERTAFGYRYTLKRMMQYTEGKALKFGELTPKWLERYDRHLAETAPSANARSIHFRNIRHVFNKALEEEWTNAPYPFKKFKILSEPTEDRSYSPEELHKLFTYPCTPIQEKYRDIFELSFLLCGINLADLLALKEIRSGRIDFRRIKTGQPVSIGVPARALNIINRYRGTDRLINVADGCADYRNWMHRLNDNLKRIGMTYNSHTKKWEGEALFPDISYYCARYSWATIAAELDIPEKTIGAALGHSTAKSVTSIYTRVNMRKKIDEANSKVLNKVYGESLAF